MNMKVYSKAIIPGYSQNFLIKTVLGKQANTCNEILYGKRQDVLFGKCKIDGSSPYVFISPQFHSKFQTPIVPSE